MANYLKKPILPQMQSIAQLGGSNNNFYDPGAAPIAQQVSPEDQLRQQLIESGSQIAKDIPQQQPYAPPDYNRASSSLPTYGPGGMIAPNENYSDPTDPKSTAYALTQGMNHLATGSLSARQNQKFQRGQAAQDLVRNFLAPLAGAFGPAGAAAGIKDYMKTSTEQAVKAKELKLKEQADAITQMKTMADMLAKNTPYTKESLEMIIKRATAEQQIKNQMAQQSAAEQRARASNVEQSDHAAGSLQKLAGILDKTASATLKDTKVVGEAAKTEKTQAQTATEKEKAKTQAATTGTRESQTAKNQAGTNKLVAETAQVAPKAAADIQQKQASAAHQNALATVAKAKQESTQYHSGPATEGDEAQILKEAAPGQADKVLAGINYYKQKYGHVTLQQLYMLKNAAAGMHEQEKAAMKGKGGSPPPPPMSFKKTRL